MRRQIAVLAFCLLAFPLMAQRTRNVLVVFEGWQDLPGNVIAAAEIHQVFSSSADFETQTFQEYVDESRLETEEVFARSAEFLQHKYAGQSFDLILAVGSSPLKIFREYHDRLFPGVPVVCFMVDAREIGGSIPPNMTIIPFRWDLAGTLRLALMLQPDTRHVFLVGGSSNTNRALQTAVRNEVKIPAGVDAAFLTDLAVPDVLDQLAHLPEHSIVMYLFVSRDITGRAYVPKQVGALIAASSNAPVYSLSTPLLGTGIVGGSVVDFQLHDRRAAEFGFRILKRQTPQLGSIQDADDAHVEVDWRQLQKWHLSGTRLPEGTRVLFAEPSLWARYKWYLVGGLCLLALQSGLIAVLLTSHRREQQSRDHLRQLSGHLIHAQEAERSRISRELHDDINQRLGVLAIELGQMRAALPPSDTVRRAELHRLWVLTNGISEDVHDLSSNLHTTTLEQVGMVSAIRSLCANFSERHRLNVEFRGDDSLAEVSPEAALCLYRVVQESLNNIARHSGAASAQVHLFGGPTSVGLEVRDQGCGFDTDEVRKKAGLGFVSMRERVRLVGGKIKLESALGRGTRLAVRIPLQTGTSRIKDGKSIYLKERTANGTIPGDLGG